MSAEVRAMVPRATVVKVLAAAKGDKTPAAAVLGALAARSTWQTRTGKTMSQRRFIAEIKSRERNKNYQIPRNLLHLILSDKARLVPLPDAQFQPVADAALPISITTQSEGAAAAAAAAPITITPAGGPAASSLTEPQQAILVDSTVTIGGRPTIDNLDPRIAALTLGPEVARLESNTFWSKLVLIAGFDPNAAYRILCDGAHDYGGLIKGYYIEFLVSVFETLNGLATAKRIPPITVQFVEDTILTSSSDRGGYNARPDVIARELENMNRLPDGDPLQLEQCLIGSGMRNGPPNNSCVSVCSLACSFGSSGLLPDSITFNIIPHYVQAADQNSVRALWGQSIPSFMDAAGTPTADGVSLNGAKFVDLNWGTLLSDFKCDGSTLREYVPSAAAAAAEIPAPDSFIVHNFYGNSRHIFTRNHPIPAEFRRTVGPVGTKLEIFNGAAWVATVWAKQSISLNGLSNKVKEISGRGKAKKTKDPIEIQYARGDAATDADRAQVMIVKQLLDWAQAYFIAMLWHNYGLIFTLVTNDTFLLRTAKWLRVPFVLLMSKNGAKLYCFDSRAMVLTPEEKDQIFANITKFTAAAQASLLAEIDAIIGQNFTKEITAVPIVGGLFKKVQQLKEKIVITAETIRGTCDSLLAAGIPAAEKERVAQSFRYLMKQDPNTYLVSKFRDDIETQVASAISVTRSINSFIGAYAKQEPPVTLTETLSSIINLMKTFLPNITPSEIGLWITKLPFPITTSRYGLQLYIVAALITRTMKVADIAATELDIMQRIKRYEDGFTIGLLKIDYLADHLDEKIATDAAAMTLGGAIDAALEAVAVDAVVVPLAVDSIPSMDDAVAIAEAYRTYAAIDWMTNISGNPSYPYYFLPGLYPEEPELIESRWDTLSYKQQQRVIALGFTSSSRLQLPGGALPEPDPPQKILKQISSKCSSAVNSPVGARGGSRKRHTRKLYKQRGGVRNGNFISLTTWDIKNYEYGQRFSKIYEEIIDNELSEVHRAAASAIGRPQRAAGIPITISEVSVSLNPPRTDWLASSTLFPFHNISPPAYLFYYIVAYLTNCFDYVDENNNDIIIADYANMLTTLSELRRQCFEGNLSEENLIIELACILLLEDDEFPSVNSTILNNRGFDKNFIFKNLRKFLPRGGEHAEHLGALHHEIDNIIGPSAEAGGASASASASAAPVDDTYNITEMILEQITLSGLYNYGTVVEQLTAIATHEASEYAEKLRIHIAEIRESGGAAAAATATATATATAIAAPVEGGAAAAAPVEKKGTVADDAIIATPTVGKVKAAAVVATLTSTTNQMAQMAAAKVDKGPDERERRLKDLLNRYTEAENALMDAETPLPGWETPLKSAIEERRVRIAKARAAKEAAYEAYNTLHQAVMVEEEEFYRAKGVIGKAGGAGGKAGAGARAPFHPGGGSRRTRKQSASAKGRKTRRRK